MLRRLNPRVTAGLTTTAVATRGPLAAFFWTLPCRPPSASSSPSVRSLSQRSACTTASSLLSAPGWLRGARRSFLTPGSALRIRVQGTDPLRPRNVPMPWENASSSHGSAGESLTPVVREHLMRVYGLLATGCAVAGVGSALMLLTPLAKTIPFWLPMVGGFVPLLWLSFAPPASAALRMGLFYAFTLLEGMAIAPLVLMTTMKGVLLTSLVLTGAVFCGFSAAAYLAPRASLVAWQGPLYGALLGMVAISLLNVFYPTAIAHSIILYGGLALFSIMIASDTQAMIERARCGAGDHVQDALRMFMNVINIFVRIAQIMGNMER